jgi:alpha-beta hydrolase superfamily lysophospholipase
MKHIDGTFQGVRHTTIYYQAWLPERGVKAVLLIVHGLGEYCGRYANVVNHFVPLGYAVYGCDHIGHGKSDGGREVVDRFEDYTDTLTIYFKMVEEWQPGKPVFLLGHSMGGLIAAFYLLDHQEKFRGAIISAPPIQVGNSVSPATIVMGKVLSVFAPKAGVLPLDATGISRDPAVVKAYVEDPLVFHAKTPARLAAELLKAMQRVSAEAGRITLPFIAVQGTGDKIVEPGNARALCNKASSKDKTLKEYEGLYHEVFNEPERDQVLKDVETWLAAHN